MITRAAPPADTAFFPLDEQLQLPPTTLLPHAHHSLVRLGTHLPFAQATKEVQALLGIRISEASVRRCTIEAGHIAEEIQSEQAHPSAARPRFPLPAALVVEQMAMGSDGGMVPLRGGVWGEVKMAVFAQVNRSTAKTEQHSSFARLTDATIFADLASAEVTRRGIAQARQVCAIQDGAEWLQGFVDGHRHDAVRILDFAHAAHYLGQVAEQGPQQGYHVPERWLNVVLHELKHAGPERIMEHLQWWKRARPLPAVTDALRYFGKRLAQMNYPQFQAQGWPIGSGMVERANKVVMQARLKGAGMHWEPGTVNPMLALRGDMCNERWEESWQYQQRWRNDHRHAQRQQRSLQRRARCAQEQRALILHICLRLPSSTFAPQPSSRKGRTEGQKRWGRQTFSHRMLQDGSAKNEGHPSNKGERQIFAQRKTTRNVHRRFGSCARFSLRACYPQNNRVFGV
ncbi:hypothetical protein KDH_27120 [Dictyobacter sp. S3.2.2.5]|uniref:ISKra4 family transposase n=1 Tax=Dictyobacter halimunensis TaxID=3026934 RepID=A0ABQ6FQK8_9CHLR|nr:hypothetical protein KDH_27120 [Dictyobacter sp. S3.2.2.5]